MMILETNYQNLSKKCLKIAVPVLLGHEKQNITQNHKMEPHPSQPSNGMIKTMAVYHRELFNAGELEWNCRFL